MINYKKLNRKSGPFSLPPLFRRSATAPYFHPFFVFFLFPFLGKKSKKKKKIGGGPNYG